MKCDVYIWQQYNCIRPWHMHTQGLHGIASRTDRIMAKQWICMCKCNAGCCMKAIEALHAHGKKQRWVPLAGSSATHSLCNNEISSSCSLHQPWCTLHHQCDVRHVKLPPAFLETTILHTLVVCQVACSPMQCWCTVMQQQSHCT